METWLHKARGKVQKPLGLESETLSINLAFLNCIPFGPTYLKHESMSPHVRHKPMVVVRVRGDM